MRPSGGDRLDRAARAWRRLARQASRSRVCAAYQHRYRSQLDQEWLARLVYGWKLHLVSTVASVWIPLAAELTPANAADNELALSLLPGLPDQTRFVLGDRHYNAPNVRTVCERDDRLLVASQYGSYPHTDDGVEVRRVFHKLRSANLETFNELFKGIFDVHGSVPTKGLRATRRFALGAIFIYQLALLARSEAGLDLRIGLKAFLKAA